MKIILRQVTAKPDWTSQTAPNPGGSNADIHGNDGEHGVNGFHGTILNIDAGCVVGSRSMLSFHIESGSGSNGQHASDGLPGLPGENAPDGKKLMWGGSRKNVCGRFTSVSF